MVTKTAMEAFFHRCAVCESFYVEFWAFLRVFALFRLKTTKFVRVFESFCESFSLFPTIPAFFRPISHNP